ncbi:MAG: response regulator [Planctomycetes bacterium]|nr:response regulator [Planctomycetota bacterium]
MRKLLVLQGPAFEAQGIIDFLREHFEVVNTNNLDEALEALRNSPFDAVLTETSDFLPLERGIVSQQASIILETIGDGVCIVGANGQMLWANRRLRSFPPSLLDPLRKLCVEAYEEFATSARKDTSRGKRFSLIPDASSYYEVICSPVRDRQGLLRQIAAVVVDATSQRKQQIKMNAIDQAGRELVRLDYDSIGRMDASERLKMLEDRIIKYIKDVLDYEHFAIMLLNERTNRLEMLISEGLSEEAEKYELFALPEGNGICGYVAATGRSYICPDVRKDPRYIRGLEGGRSSLTVPLMLKDKVIGLINAESRSVGVFGEEDRQFAEIFSNYLALALNILNLLVYERHTVASQFTGSVCTQLTGPLNDSITELSGIIEENIGDDDLRRRLQDVIDSLAKTRKCVQQISQSGTTGVIASPQGPQAADPLLAGKTILVVDDEELIRQTIRDVLSPYGCQIELCPDGAEAIARINQKQYDLIISDIKMPGATGYDVYAAAKAAHGDTPVILVTGFGWDPHHSAVKIKNTGGAVTVLMKPFKVRQLLDYIHTALAAR